MHEVCHSNVGGSLSDPTGPIVFGQTGDVVDRMNIIRSQLGSDYGQRTSYAALPLGQYAYIPFSQVTRTMLSHGLIPSTSFIRYKTR